MYTMEDMMISNKHRSSSIRKQLTMHQDSRIISKIKPKIRIIHIFAPEIIKTDVANFRELVQRLTGKPTEKKKLKVRKESLKRPRFSQVGSEVEEIKEEDEIWVGANSGDGFLGRFGDLDHGFMQEFSHHNHVFTSGSPHLDTPTLVNSHLQFTFEES
ncbi:hypothetical protein L1987_64259 [Smallanthus sonchifolius]|uniref:Uncharacterized protein n=1 Tax=Smallanthus sonchifolius TaxID=185202 RepID=A0ACB9CFI3_9ASTR|nr:hypothetical protein L1987_64259 [Smallanthus sonchifolius]